MICLSKPALVPLAIFQSLQKGRYRTFNVAVFHDTLPSRFCKFDDTYLFRNPFYDDDSLPIVLLGLSILPT